MNRWRGALVLVGVACGVLAVFGPGCGRNVPHDLTEDEDAEIANSAGDTMAGLDEGSAGAGIASWMPPARQRSKLMQLLDLVEGSAYAASCTLSWNGCSQLTNGPAGTTWGKSITLSNCTVGGIAVEGSVAVDFSTQSPLHCTIPNAGDYFVRVPDFTLSRSGYKVSVAPTAPTGGQKITRTGALSFDFDGLGIERKGLKPDGGLFFDVVTTTSAPLQVSFTSSVARANRFVDAGTLVIEHKLANYTTTLGVQGLQWSASCNCAVSGKLTGQHSGSRTGSFTMTLTGCGTATISGAGRDGGTFTSTVDVEQCHPL